MKLLLPVNRCSNRVIGVKKLTLSEIAAETVEELKKIIG